MSVDAASSSLKDRVLHIIAGLATAAQRGQVDETLLAEQVRLAIDELRTAVRDETTAGDEDATLVVMDQLSPALVTDYEARVSAAAAHGGVVGVRTGIEHLDEVINGLEAGKLYLLAAMPGAGKTTLALQVAATVAQSGSYALYVSLENDAADLARKTVCRLENISYASALKGKVTPQMWRQAVQGLAVLRGRLFLSTPRKAMPDLVELVEQIQRQAGQPPAVIVIDYLQAWVKRLTPQVDEADIRERIDRFAPALRDLAERYGCAVLAISSQNRAGYQNGGMAALKESGDLEYLADVSLSLARDKEKEKNKPIGPTGYLKLTVDKNRQGMTGRPIDLVFRGDFCMIDEDDLAL